MKKTTQKLKHTQTNMMGKTRDEYLTSDRSIIVDTCKNTQDVTVEVTLFNPVADRFFDRLPEEKRDEWAKGFFNGKDGPLLNHFAFSRHGH